MRVGYPSPKLLRTLSKRMRGSLRGRVVWGSTSNPYYSLRGIRPGAQLALAARRLRLRPGFHVGRNWWYFGRGGKATPLLKVRHGVVEEIGIACKSVTRGRRGRRRFVHSFY